MSNTTEPVQALEARMQLRKELEPHIDILHVTRGEPPFTLGELIVCAIIFHDKNYATAEDIAKWIMKACTFYAHQAVDKYMATIAVQEEDPYDDGFMSQVSFPIPGFWDAMKEYDLPLEVQETVPSADFTSSGRPKPKRALGRYNSLRRRGNTTGYTVGAGPARLYLQRWLHQRGGHFRFFDLAPELRNRIYKLLLVYDEEGHLAKKHTLVLPAPMSPGSQSLAKVERSKDLDKVREDTTRTIALLAICKQARHKARGIFYSFNTFYYEGLTALGRSLLKSSGVNLDVLRRLSLCVDFLPHQRGNPLNQQLGTY